MSHHSDALALLRGTIENPETGLSALSMGTGILNNAWQQILPAGFFSAVDGRPFEVSSRKWYLDQLSAQKMISEVKSRSTEVVIDYEHQTVLAERNGKPAPAAGWIKDIEWREGSGLWIKPSWTERAKQHISGGEYRYLSAAFPYDTATGIPISLHSVALVNKPGIDGMAEVASLKATPPSSITPQSMPRTSELAVLSSTEKEVLSKAFISSDIYLEQRDAFCRSKGTSWTKLSELTPEETQVVKNMQLDPKAYMTTKVRALVKDVLWRFPSSQRGF